MSAAPALRIVIIAPESLSPDPADVDAWWEAERSRSLRIGLLENGYNIVAVLPADIYLPDRLAQIQPDMIIVDAESEARDTLEHVVMATRNARRPIVLIERRNPPLGFALPGGFVDIGETLEQAVCREAREETGLDIRLVALLGCYSHPARDPRGHTISAVYVAEARGELQAGDDARATLIADPAERGRALAFDHRLILDDYLHYLKNGKPAPLRGPD